MLYSKCHGKFNSTLLALDGLLAAASPILSLACVGNHMYHCMSEIFLVSNAYPSLTQLRLVHAYICRGNWCPNNGRFTFTTTDNSEVPTEGKSDLFTCMEKKGVQWEMNIKWMNMNDDNFATQIQDFGCMIAISRYWMSRGKEWVGIAVLKLYWYVFRLKRWIQI